MLNHTINLEASISEERVSQEVERLTPQILNKVKSIVDSYHINLNGLIRQHQKTSNLLNFKTEQLPESVTNISDDIIKLLSLDSFKDLFVISNNQDAVQIKINARSDLFCSIYTFVSHINDLTTQLNQFKNLCDTYLCQLDKLHSAGEYLKKETTKLCRLLDRQINENSDQNLNKSISKSKEIIKQTKSKLSNRRSRLNGLKLKITSYSEDLNAWKPSKSFISLKGYYDLNELRLWTHTISPEFHTPPQVLQSKKTRSWKKGITILSALGVVLSAPVAYYSSQNHSYSLQPEELKQRIDSVLNNKTLYHFLSSSQMRAISNSRDKDHLANNLQKIISRDSSFQEYMRSNIISEKIWMSYSVDLSQNESVTLIIKDSILAQSKDILGPLDSLRLELNFNDGEKIVSKSKRYTLSVAEFKRLKFVQLLTDLHFSDEYKLRFNIGQVSISPKEVLIKAKRLLSRR